MRCRIGGPGAAHALDFLQFLVGKVGEAVESVDPFGQVNPIVAMNDPMDLA